MSELPPNPADQRTAPRRSLIVPVTVLVAADRRLAGRTLDVSAVGLGLTLPESLPSGSAVAVAFELPTPMSGPVPIRAGGRIAYCALVPKTGRYRTGVQWVTMGDELRRLVRAFSMGLQGG